MGAAFYRDRGSAPMAALLLHQACEHLYQCMAWSLTLHGPRTHALGELREVAEELDERIVAAWPRDTAFEQRVFGCIRRAYGEVRCGNGFRISDDELAFAFDCTRTLSAIMERVCADRLMDIAPVLAGAVHA